LLKTIDKFLKPKVLIILNRLVIGGQAIDTIPLIYRLKENFELLILYGCKEKDEMEASFLLDKFKDLRLIPMPHFRRKLNIFNDVRAFFFILSTISKFKPGVVHTHGLKSGVMGRIAAYLAGIKCIIHTFHGHHFHSYFSPFVSKFIILTERLLSKITTKIIAISPEQKYEFASIYKIAPPEKILVIPLGIDENLFQKHNEVARLNFRNRYSVHEKTIAIGIIGRIVPVKNYSLFTEVAAKILAQTGEARKVKFFVIGDGQEKKMVEAQLDKYNIPWCGQDDAGVDTDVIFTSWVTDVASALHAMDVVMLTSHNEGTPLSLIEAQFCGKPVVATNVGGVKDTFINGESGFLVPSGDVKLFTEKLMLLVNNDVLRMQMGGKAADFAAKNFSKAKEIDSFRLLYQSCAK